MSITMLRGRTPRRLCLYALATSFVIVALLAAPVAAASGVDSRPVWVYVDGERVDLDGMGRLQDGTALVPVRPIVEAMGGLVEYDAESGKILLFADGCEVELEPGSASAAINGEEVTLDVPVRVVHGRAMAPARFLAETLGASDLAWDGASRSLAIATVAGASATVPSTRSLSCSKEELDLLSRVVYAEALSEPYEGKVAVAAVVLNRVESRSFPDTIEEVIYQPGQFPSIKSPYFYSTVSDAATRAAIDALRGWDPSNGALFFYNPKKSNSDFFDGRTVVAVIGDHRFTK